MTSISSNQFSNRLVKSTEKLITGRLSPNALIISICITLFLTISCILSSSYIAGLFFWIINRLLENLYNPSTNHPKKQSIFQGFLIGNLNLISYSSIIIAFAFASPTALLTVSLGLILTTLLYINIGQLLMIGKIPNELIQRNMPKLPTSIIETRGINALYILCYLFPKSINLIWLIFIMLLVGNIIQRMIWSTKEVRQITYPYNINPKPDITVNKQKNS